MNDKRPDHPAGETPDAATVPPILDLRIEKLVTGGTGLARHEGQAVFVPLTAPGDDVRVEIVERKKGFLRASLTELVTPGAGRRSSLRTPRRRSRASTRPPRTAASVC